MIYGKLDKFMMSHWMPVSICVINTFYTLISHLQLSWKEKVSVIVTEIWFLNLTLDDVDVHM